MLEQEAFPDAGSIISHLDIPAEEVAILLINGFHKKPSDSVKDGDVVALFPPVGGG
jgi:molybdopterin converting factor small subunit